MFNFFILHATIIEDAGTPITSQWKQLNSGATSSIKNVQDKSKKSHVIEFKGAGTKQIYAFYTSELKNKQSHEYWVSWDMKFSEDFVIILEIQSNLGKHYLIYTPGTFNSYMQYGLGNGVKNGEWQTFRRNIQKDIAYFDNRVKIVSLKRFVVKGNGMIANIKTILGSQKSRLNDKQRVSPPPQMQKEPKREPKVEKRKRVFKTTKSSSPIIHLKGRKLIKLKLGESYVEPGVSAYDKEDGAIDVVTMENIYGNEVGRYLVLYMATDSDGNIAMEKRYVEVGDVKVKKRTSSLAEKVEVEREENTVEESERGAPEDDDEEDVSELSQEAAQMRLWERKLELREKELAKRRE